MMRLMALFAVLVVACLTSDVKSDEPKERVFTWHKSEVTGLAFLPDGTRLISTSLRDDRISTIVPDEGSSILIGDSVGVITGARSHAVAISPDGTQVAIAGFKVTAMYDLKTQNQQWRIDTTSDDYSPPCVNALAFSPNGKLLATSGRSAPHGNKGLITIRNADTGKEIHRFEGWPHQPDGLVDFSHDGIAFSPDGKLFAAGTYGAGGEGPKSGELRVWDADSGKLIHSWKVVESVAAGEEHFSLTGIDFSPDSRSIAIACSSGTVFVWDVASQKLRLQIKGHTRGVRRVAYSPDARLLASGGNDMTVRIWNPESGHQLKSFTVEAPKINAIAFSPDGKFLIAGGGNFLRSGEVRLWSVTDIEVTQ